nr:uncharacterized protein LOC129143575 [Pan troglodytes]
MRVWLASSVPHWSRPLARAGKQWGCPAAKFFSDLPGQTPRRSAGRHQCLSLCSSAPLDIQLPVCSSASVFLSLSSSSCVLSPVRSSQRALLSTCVRSSQRTCAPLNVRALLSTYVRSSQRALLSTYVRSSQRTCAPLSVRALLSAYVRSSQRTCAPLSVRALLSAYVRSSQRTCAPLNVRSSQRALLSTCAPLNVGLHSCLCVLPPMCSSRRPATSVPACLSWGFYRHRIGDVAGQVVLENANLGMKTGALVLPYIGVHRT